MCQRGAAFHSPAAPCPAQIGVSAHPQQERWYAMTLRRDCQAPCRCEIERARIAVDLADDRAQRRTFQPLCHSPQRLFPVLCCDVNDIPSHPARYSMQKHPPQLANGFVILNPQHGSAHASLYLRQREPDCRRIAWRDEHLLQCRSGGHESTHRDRRRRRGKRLGSAQIIVHKRITCSLYVPVLCCMQQYISGELQLTADMRRKLLQSSTELMPALNSNSLF